MSSKVRLLWKNVEGWPVEFATENVQEMFGYKVLTAPDGESGLGLYRRDEGRIDLVVLDLIMPPMGGKRVLEELLKIDPKVKILVATGYSDIGRMKDTVDAGAKRFIGKPYEMRELLRIVSGVLDEDDMN